MKALDRAIQLAGGNARLADRFQVRAESVRQWRARGRAPANGVVAIAEAVNFQVTPHELVPSLYPNPDDGIPGGAR